MENPEGFSFCGGCGANLAETEATSPTPAPAEAPAEERAPAPRSGAEEPAGERRQITVVFCDIVGSTGLSESLDPEDLRDIVREYQSAAAAVVERYSGHIAQYLGDGILVYFGYPNVHEDDPIRAVHAGMGILKAVAELDTKVKLPDGQRLEARIGIHTGLVVAGEVGAGEHREQLAMGQTPNVAARLEALAGPGEIVLSGFTQRLVATHFQVESIGHHALKGLSEPVEVFRVVGEFEADPFEVLPADQILPLVGRQREVRQLSELWERATEGRGQVVLLTGEAGVGKSRLTRAFREELAERPHTYLWARGHAFNESTTFSPMVEMLSRLCGIQKDDSRAERFRKLEDRLAEHGLAGTEDAVLLAELLELPVPEGYPEVELPPLRKKQRTVEVLISFMQKMAEGQPLLLVVEDLHWLDPSTHEFLEHLVMQGPTNPMLSFFTTRPQDDPAWANRSYVTRLNLTNLGQDEVEAMVLRVTGGKSLPEPVMEQIISKTDGVPLFVEELTKMILESGVLTEGDDHFELSGDLGALTIPSSLQDSLNARLDALSEGKAVAQTAATIDREFSYPLLKVVWNREEDALRTGLAELAEAEFLYQRGTPPHSSYIFKHALIQDAASESLLRSRRQRIHRRVADALEAVYLHRTGGEVPTDLPFDVEELAEVVEPTAERVALHFGQAGEAVRSVDWWLAAAMRGMERGANQEVVEHMTRALELLEELEPTAETLDRELSCQSLLGAALTGAVGYAAPEVQEAFSRALALANETGDDAKIFQAQLGLWMFHVVRADFPAALEDADVLQALAEKADDRSYRVEAGFALGCTEFFMGRPAEALQHLEVAVEHDGPDRDRSISRRSGQDAGVTSLVYMGMCHWMLGDPAAALERALEAIELAERIEHPYSHVYALHFTSWIRLWMGQYDDAQELADRVIAMSLELGYFWVTLASIVRGRVLVEKGSVEEGMAQMSGGLGPYRGAGAKLSQTLQLALMAEGHVTAGRMEEALGTLEEARQQMADTDERFWEADICRVEALALASSDAAAALSAAGEAVAIARRQGSVGHELKAALTLAQLLTEAGRVDEAKEALRTAREGYTTGFDLPDVQAADAILGG